MARLARLAVAGQLHLVSLHAHGQLPVFRDAADRQAWIDWMADYAREEQVSVHAYVLLDRWVGLLATPAQAQGIPRWMQAVGRRYGRYFNDRHQQRGTLWDGRYRCTVVDAENLALTVMVFLDLASVREGLAIRSDQYPWCSHLHYAGHRQDRFLTPLTAYWSLGNTPFAREAAYASLVHAGLDQALVTRIQDAADKAWVLGESPFVEQLQAKVPRRVTKGRPGRPRKPGTA
ncbi:MAG: transposase [Gammaproteobacteria bacterium]